MQTIKKVKLLVLGMLLSSLAQAQPAQNPQTFCNPMNLNYRFMVDAVDARETADPVIILFKEDYYLFASRAGGYWTSTDLRNWTFIVPTGLDVEGYAPTAVVMRDTVFYTHGWGGSGYRVYKTADPKSGVWIQGPGIEPYGDPNFYLDDDGRLYMYDGLSNSTTTAIVHVVELDPVTFQEIGNQVNLVYSNAATHGWERRGDDNLLDEQPWLEGVWMVKKNNKYYLHYAGPGTEFKTYADGIYVADSPLGPYEYANYSPFSFKPTGFICGAGHGSTFIDKDGHYWHIATMTISVNDMFERRLGLWPVSFDADGQIRCNTDFGDYPQYYPGVKANPIDDNFTGMMLLSRKKRTFASSSLTGHGVDLAVDEEVRTYWIAATGGNNEWMMIDLGQECSVEAIQVNFAEHNTIPGQVRGSDKVLYEQYTIEKSPDGMTWGMLIDKSQNTEDVPHDYIELENPVTTRYIRLTNVFTPGGGNFAVRDLRIFGNSGQAVFTKVNDTDFTVERDAADGRDAIIRWTPVADADGYIIRYGIALDKLYNNYMVYDADSVAMHSLNHGVDYYFDIEAFDSGTENYQPVGEFYSFQSGDWNDVTTWAQYDGASWIHPAPNVPSLSDGAITILDGHTVTVTAADSIDQLMVASGGTLVINEGVTFKIKNGIGFALMVEGTVRNKGSMISEDLATLNFTNNGLYEHAQDGGTIPTITWRPGSTCLINSVKGSAPANGNQDFYNVVWNCRNQTGNKSMKWNGNSIGGNITIQNTGSGRWQMCAPSTSGTATVNVNGDIVQTGGQFSSNGTDNGGTSIIIAQKGDVKVSGGNFAVSRGSQGGTGTTMWYLMGDTISIANATTQNSNKEGAKFIFAKQDGDQSFILENVTYGSGGFPVEVDSGASLAMGTSILEGSGDFVLKPGATLYTGAANGINASIQNSGTQGFDEEANYGFNGTVSQVTGSLMPGSISKLIIGSEATVTLSNSVTVNEAVEMVDGELALGGNTLTYGSEASLIYSGTSTKTTTDAEFPETNGPKDLIISSTKTVTLHASRSVNNLYISYKLKIDDHILTVDSVTNSGVSAFVRTSEIGALRIRAVGNSEILFPVGTTTFAPVWVKNTGKTDTIGVNVVRETRGPDDNGRVNVRWNIFEDIEGDGEFRLTFGWMRSLEDSDFRQDRSGCARIYNLQTVTEAGTGDYTTQFSTQPYSVSRGGITELGPFGVGLFSETGINRSSDNVSRRFSLEQNYPNPFNPLTRINFEMPVKSFVSLRVFNLLGEEIDELAGKEFLPGEHSVIFDASHLASGIYFYILRIKDFTQTKKMVIMK